jgi:hypothetical protein
MKRPLRGRQRTAEARRAQDARSALERAPVTWARAQLREQIQQAGAASAPATEPAHRRSHEPEHSPLADREGRTVTTTDRNITQDLTPVEAASLLDKLEEGHQAAWLSTREVPWQSAEYQARFQNAAEVDGVFRDLMWETVENGMRRPGEPVEEFAERAEAEARRADARASTEPPADMTSKHAGIARERPAENQDELASHLLNDASTPEGRAYARAFSDTAATSVRELREHDPLPEPDRTPGAPHPDRFLASRGWHVNDHGIYTRRAQPEPQAPPERDLEAGS